jgi:hypothetical protein
MNLVESTFEAAHYVAHHLRVEDEMEVWLSHHVPGPEAVLSSWAESDLCACIETEDGVPAGVTGVVGDRIWMLGTPELTATKERRLHLCTKGRGWVQHCIDQVGMPLGNYVYAKNRPAIRWLRYLGFEVGVPQPYGPSAALFRPFWRLG